MRSEIIPAINPNVKSRYSGNGEGSHYIKGASAIDDTTSRFMAHLHRGDGWRFAQAIGEHNRITGWIEPGKDFTFPASWNGKYNIYFGVNTASAPVLDSDRAKYPGKNDAQIMRIVASKNASINSINCLISEFDGKDFTNPTQEEIEQAFIEAREDAELRFASGELKKMLPIKVLNRVAHNAAQNTKYASNPEYYKALAFAHVKSLALQPSVLVNSGGGVQGYWLLEETFRIDTKEERSFAKTAQRRFTMWTGGDQSVKDLRRVLRVPGTLNVKAKYAPNYPLVDYAWCNLDQLYTLDELLAHCPEIMVEPARKKTGARGSQPVRNIDPSSDDDVWLDGYEWAVAQAYNDTYKIRDILLENGYSDHGDRMSRPGEPASKGVIVDDEDNASFHFSGNDALYSEHLRRPFDVIAIYDYDGDYSAAAEEWGERLGIVDPKWIDVAREYVLSNDIGKHVPCEYKAKRMKDGEVWDYQYRTRKNDTVILTNILDIMAKLGRANDVKVNRYQVLIGKSSEGLEVQSLSRDALDRTLPRHAWLFDAKAIENDAPSSTGKKKKTNTWIVSLRTEMLGSAKVTSSNEHYIPATEEIVVPAKVTSSNECNIIGDLQEKTKQDLEDETITFADTDQINLLPAKVIVSSSNECIISTFTHWKFDDQFQSGTSRFMRQSARRESMDGDEDSASDILDLLPSGLGALGILVVDALINAGGAGATVGDIASEFGLTKSTVNGIVKKLRDFGLVTSKRYYMAPSVHWIAPDAFKELNERRYEMRTYKIGACRLERTLEHAQNCIEHKIMIAENAGESTVDLEKKRTKIAERRRPLVHDIYPGMTDEEATRWLYTPKPTGERPPQAPVHEVGEPAVNAWMELFELKGKESLSAGELARLKSLDNLLEAGLDFADDGSKPERVHLNSALPALATVLEPESEELPELFQYSMFAN